MKIESKLVTVLLLSWKRAANLLEIIEDIRRQSIPTEIFLWNNNADDETQYPVDLQVSSSKNLMCWTRWLLSSYASGNYICTVDDDLSFRDDNVLLDGIRYCEKHDCAVGGFGAILNPNRKYIRSRHIRLTKDVLVEDVEVDVLKGRFILTSAEFIKNVVIHPEPATVDMPRVEDDIIISSYLKRKIVPAIFNGRFKDLPTYGDSLMYQKGHMNSREKARRKHLCK